MEQKNEIINVKCMVNTAASKVWELWTTPEHIINWNHASDDWHTPFAENDLRPGGRFTYKMAAKDGSFSFDFSGIYDEVKINEKIAYTIDDGRKVSIEFSEAQGKTQISETFEAEGTNPVDMQQSGWQAILNNFKAYAASK